MMMSCEAPNEPGPLPRRRRTAVAAVASLAGSVAVHAAFAAAAAGIAWHIAHREPVPARDVVIRFEDPAAVEGDEDALKIVSEAAQSAAAPVAARDAAAAELPRAELLIEEDSEPAGLPESLLSAAAQPMALHLPAAGTADAAAASEASGDAGTGGVRFAGLGASNARSVVYVVDASGPMVTSMPRVIEELRRSVDQLATAQKFGVVLFRRTEAGQGAELFAPVLMRATPTAKRRLAEWLTEVTPAGASNPLTGLEAALALKPDAVFLLSRSIARSGGGVWEEGLEATLSRLEGLNPRSAATGARPTLIQTIQFLDDDPTGIMQAIGARHGQGNGYRVVRRGEDIAGRGR